MLTLKNTKWKAFLKINIQNIKKVYSFTLNVSSLLLSKTAFFEAVLRCYPASIVSAPVQQSPVTASSVDLHAAADSNC
jgi:hypothetical protein